MGPPIDITGVEQRNNGNIEVLNVERSVDAEKLAMDEFMMNGRRYRVPERVIILDFWSKLRPELQRSYVTFCFHSGCLTHKLLQATKQSIVSAYVFKLGGR